ncbi:MAG: trehalose-phosphatase [Actinobacteria bacterium 13_2_20CM_2_66_6]|nr:MAG: trehalose-phosphatase [Actinobacteria bacterium 13_2_20CM_2_66_6]
MFEVMSIQPQAQPTITQEAWRLSPLAGLRPRDVMLVTDFDGTLSEIVSDPSQSTILPASRDALTRLAGSLRRVAVVSSRSTEDLERRVPVRGVDLIGDSGLGLVTADERGRLDQFNLEAGRILHRFPGVWLEMKSGATAIHHRNSTAGREELMDVLRPVSEETGLHMQPGRRVIEVIPRDHPKGDMLEAMIEMRRPLGIICIGDDENDRPMFELVASLRLPHLTIGVASSEAAPDLFASCDLVVSDPQEVSRFLTIVAEWAERGNS